MKIKDLNNGTIDLIEVSETRTIPPFGNRTEVCTFDDIKIETKIYTDGIIDKLRVTEGIEVAILGYQTEDNSSDTSKPC